jgi:hypothetical protein
MMLPKKKLSLKRTSKWLLDRLQYKGEIAVYTDWGAEVVVSPDGAAAVDDAG